MNAHNNPDIIAGKVTLGCVGTVVSLILLISITSLPGLLFSTAFLSIYWILLFFINFIIFIGIALGYTIISAFVVSGVLQLRRWAHSVEVGEIDEWREDSKLFFGAFWIFVTIPALVIFLFLGIINRLYYIGNR